MTMKITKHGHACVEFGDGDLLIDPGTMTTDAAELVARTPAVLITHEHPDHVDVDLIGAALRDRDDLQVWGPSGVVDQWADEHADRVHPVSAGDTFEANGVAVAVHGEQHAVIHHDIPTVANVGYLVGGSVYHPGDAYHVPAVEVPTLLLPTSGPWTKLSEAVDYVRAVRPTTLVQIHESMLSDLGQAAYARFLAPDQLGSVPLRILAVGESLEV